MFIYLIMIMFIAAFSASTCFASAANAPVPKTGQTISYADYDDGWHETKVGVEWPNPRFTDNGDGTVTDNLTGLIWLKDAYALGNLAWASAAPACAAVSDGMYGLTDGSAAGDWRLPNARELHSLCHFGQHDPALSDTAGTGQWSAGNPFANVQSLGYWSITSYKAATGYAYQWNVLFGRVDTDAKSGGAPVWPVRGTTTGPAPIPKMRAGDTGNGVAWPNPRFADNGDGTVTDNLTGLIWLKDADAFGKLTWASALTACAAVSDGMYGLTDGSAAGDWRLPNARELHSLCHLGQHDPALPNTAGTGQWSAGNPFTNVQSLRYWSSTTYKGGTSNAYYWHALYGAVVHGAKNTAYYVWPVRGPRPPSGTIISFY